MRCKPRFRGWIGLALLVASASLGGCGSLLNESTATAAGVAGGALAGAVTKDAGIGAAIGIGVTTAANAALLYVERRTHRVEQDSIAATAGALPVGTVAPWQVSHVVPLETDRHGRVVVSREFSGPDFACREIVFSVEDGVGDKLSREFFTAIICRDGEVWHWATAEPATARWNTLQ